LTAIQEENCGTTHTNQRGKSLKEFILTSDLLLMKEATDISTLETIRGCSWIDLTLCNNILAQNTTSWTYREEESCSDHKLILFDIEPGTSGYNAFTYARKRYQKKQNVGENLRRNWCLTYYQDSIV
jgi:hypothetical protein